MRIPRRRSLFFRIALALGLLLAAGSVAAEGSSPKALASREFERGLAFVNQADFELAVGAFEAAYQASPHYSVLYNLGQAYASLGRHVDAVAALEKYLEDGASRIGEARKKQVAELIRREEARIGTVTISANREDASVSVNGKALAPGAASSPVRLAAGAHVIAATAPGYRPAAVSLDVRAGETELAKLELVAEVEAPATGSLRVLPDRPAPEVTVDGRLYQGGELSLGAHRVRVRRAGYQVWEHSVEIGAGPNSVVQVDLQPNPVRAGASEAGHGARRTWAIATGIGGVVFAGAATATYVWNAGRFNDWQTDREHVDAELAKGNLSDGVLAMNEELANRASDIQRVDDLALGMAIGGAALLVTSGVLWLTGASH